MSGSVDRYSWDQVEEFAAYETGADLWTRTDYTAADVDTVQFYDGFAFLPITWLEGLGFCPRAKEAASSKVESASRAMANCRSTRSAGSSARADCTVSASRTRP